MEGMNLEFRQLEYFTTISKLENFTRTAEVLHVSQPSVTKAIKALEAEFKITLIDRSQKHVSLTPEGRAFLLHAEKILRDVEETYQDMQRFQIHSQGTVHFGIPPMLEAYLFPDFFTEFRNSHPRITLDVQEFGDSVEVRNRIGTGDLDFGVILDEEGNEDEHTMLVMKDYMSLCVNFQHPLAALERAGFGQLRNEKFIMQHPRTFQYQGVYERCVQQSFTPDILLCTSQLKTIKQLVANQMGISILPDFVTRTETIFKRIPLQPPFAVGVYLFWDEHKILSDTDQKFLGFMKKYIATEEFKKHFEQE